MYTSCKTLLVISFVEICLFRVTFETMFRHIRLATLEEASLEFFETFVVELDMFF